MSSDLMIKDTLYGILAISNGETNHDTTDSIAIIMDNTGRRNSIFDKLISQQIGKLKLLDILIKNGGNLLDIK